ncbi:MAG TPA: diadenylate cyclase CdaA [Candidatus Polarisedimenticolia bacterium]|jgi:diadenylate cyclase|nr:diadenylate cyclase CdaA [Candidatus Polarisedimenticolia bacterium]
MIESFLNQITALNLDWRDLADILIMTILIYQLGLLLKGTRALQTLLGVLLVLLLYSLTAPERFLYMRTIHRVLGHVLFYAPFAIIILFQTTIRRALARLGRTSLLRLGYAEMTDRMLDEIIQAAVTLAARPTGALIVIEREQALPDQIDSGIQLDASISYDLLMNVFTPGSPMHDGAVIIGEGRVKAASCFLPVTTNPQLSHEYGSRHRAAVGLTEEYDSVVIVISEEHGTIRGAVDGGLSGLLDRASLRAFLRTHLGGRDASHPDAGAAATRTHAA